MGDKPQILIVDDSKLMLKVGVRVLGDEFEVIQALQGQEAWDILQQNNQIQAAFVDLSMPVMDGYQLLKKIRDTDDDYLTQLPVIIVTGDNDNEETKNRVLELGATDFISKPYDPVHLKSRARSVVRHRDQVTNLEKQSSIDAITGLVNERHFSAQGEKELSFAKRHHEHLCIIYFEIDDFDQLFLRFGKKNSNLLVKHVAHIVQKLLRREDTSARLGLAKFALLLPATDYSGGTRVLIRLQEQINQLPLEHKNEKVNLTISAGYTAPSLTEATFPELQNNAIQGLKQAKQQGANKYCYYDSASETPTQSQSDDAIFNFVANSNDIAQMIDQINNNQSSTLTDEQVKMAIKGIIPLLEHADSRLRLDIGDAIKALNLC